MLRAGIQRLGHQPVQHGDDAVCGIVGQMRVADMPLLAPGFQGHRQGASAADLGRVAERLYAGRLADDAAIEVVALCRRPAEQLDGAIDRGAFLVTRDEEADRALRPPMALEIAGRRSDEAGDLAFHVDDTSAEEPPITDLGAERVCRPGVQVTWRHDVGMPGEGEMGRRITQLGEQIVDRRLTARREAQPFDSEAETV